MPSDHSFDIVSKVDLTEIDNAYQQAMKEIANRWDFRGKTAEIEWNKNDKKIIATASEKYVMDAMLDIFKTRLAKRGVSSKSLDLKLEEPAQKGGLRWTYEIKQGIPSEKAKIITKMVKERKFKVQASIQGDEIRVSGKSLDDLQAVQQAVREMDLDFPVSFQNYK
jgi:cyclic-di-GMP-binding protein